MTRLIDSALTVGFAGTPSIKTGFSESATLTVSPEGHSRLGVPMRSVTVTGSALHETASVQVPDGYQAAMVRFPFPSNRYAYTPLPGSNALTKFLPSRQRVIVPNAA